MGKHEQPAGRHRASPNGRRPSRRKKEEPGSRARREPLRDHYYYQEPYGQRGERAEFEDISSYSSESRRSADRRQLKRPAKPPRSPRRKMGLGKKLCLSIALLFLVLIGLGWYMLGGLTVHRLEGEISVNRSVGQAGVKNIALFGLDSRDNSGWGRSDAIMVLSLNSREHKLKIASFMRDSEVYIEDYGYDKLTHAYAYGGPELAVRTLNENFSMDIEDYVTDRKSVV